MEYSTIRGESLSSDLAGLLISVPNRLFEQRVQGVTGADSLGASGASLASAAASGKSHVPEGPWLAAVGGLVVGLVIGYVVGKRSATSGP